ncbi:hypothetical protein [Phocaeicola sartorii]|uniref:hypothetical protein n=1 Tax=Phocaeicola sartorii TaxID=671267 RepID=UPI003F690A71
MGCGDPYYMAPANARRMAAELSVLPAWYAEQEVLCGWIRLKRVEAMERQSFFAACGQLGLRIRSCL